MNEKLQKELFRLVKEVQEHERDLDRAEMFKNERNIANLKERIQRKTLMIEILSRIKGDE